MCHIVGCLVSLEQRALCSGMLSTKRRKFRNINDSFLREVALIVWCGVNECGGSYWICCVLSVRLFCLREIEFHHSSCI